MIYFDFSAIYEAQNANNTRILAIWLDDKLHEVYVTYDFNIVKRWQ